VGTFAAVQLSVAHADISARADAGYRPFIAIVALLALMAIARLSFGPRRRGARLPSGSRTIADLGLLVPLGKLTDRVDAELLRDRLQNNGVRASISAEHDGFIVLVFRTDEGRARALMQSQ
jgi:hypothetical protein